MLRPKLRLAIIVSSILFGLNSLLYLYNPYWLLRPLQIKEDNSVEELNLNGRKNSIFKVPNQIYDLLKIPDEPGFNFSTTRKTRVNLYLKGIGNCSQKSSGMGEVVQTRFKFDYSIVHFLPRKGLFEGYGHTILNITGDSISFLIDPLLQIIPIVEDDMLGKRLMNIQDLNNRSNIYQLNSNKLIENLNNEYWESDFKAAYSEVSQSDMEKYFNATDALTSLLGLDDDTHFKRILVNGVMAMSLNLPTLKVKQEDYNRLCRIYPNFVFLKSVAWSYLFNFYLLNLLVFVHVLLFKILRLN